MCTNECRFIHIKEAAECIHVLLHNFPEIKIVIRYLSQMYTVHVKTVYDWPGNGWLAIPWENALRVQKGQKKTASVLPARMVAVQSFKRTSQRRA